MKKILIVHNTYMFKGGEDVAVYNETNLLTNYFEVETLIFKNEIKNYFKQIFFFITNKNTESRKQLINKLINFGPLFSLP